MSDVLPAKMQNMAREFRNGHLLKVGEAEHTVQGDNPRALAEVLQQFLARVLPE